MTTASLAASEISKIFELNKPDVNQDGIPQIVSYEHFLNVKGYK